jgi:hypothetical protein
MVYIRSVNRFILISLALLGVSVTTVNATLISADDAIFGTGAITIDPTSGFEWLDVNQSVGRSYNDVSGQFTDNGDYAGWRYATVAEIRGLYFTAGASSTYSDGLQSVGSTLWMDKLFDVWGFTWTGINERRSYVISAEQSGALGQSKAILRNFTDNTMEDFSDRTYGNALRSGPSDAIASALVRASPVATVPAPATIWLFGTALISLLGFGKRKIRISA